MADKKPPYKRRMTPSFGGVEIPPRTGKEPEATSNPPTAEEHATWETVKQIHADMGELRKELAEERGRDLQWRAEVEDKLSQHEEDLQQLRDNALATREMRQELRELARDQNNLSKDIRDLLRSDATQSVDMGKLEARVIERIEAPTREMADAAGTEAGAREAKKRSWLPLILSILAVVAAGFKACTELVKLAPHDPITDPAELRKD